MGGREGEKSFLVRKKFRNPTFSNRERVPGCSLCVSAAGRERVPIKEPLHTGLMQPDSLISLSAGISAPPRRPLLGLLLVFISACAADLDASVPPASPARDPQHTCLLRGCRRRKSWHGIVLPARAVSPAPSPLSSPPPTPLAGLLPPPLLHLFSLFSPLTRTLPPAGAPPPPLPDSASWEEDAMVSTENTTLEQMSAIS